MRYLKLSILIITLNAFIYSAAIRDAKLNIFLNQNYDDILSRSDYDRASCGYLSCPKTDESKLNVHLVPHSHDDVGWLKTVDQYYYGTRMRDAAVGVQHILDSIIPQLVMDPTKRFIYVEMSFFSKWWNEQDDQVRTIVKRLVSEGRLEFINGGWCMNDEATVNYQSTIEQMTLGLKFLNETFGACAHPKVGWQIDPFGHTNEQASLFAQFGFDGFYFTRESYEDKVQRKQNKTLDLIWHGDRVLPGQQGSIFTNVFKDTYDAPSGYCFDVLCQEDNLVDNKNSYEYNIEARLPKFIQYLRDYSKTKAHNHLLIPMGGDFQYSAAGQNFKNLDKLIKFIRKNASDEFHIFYSTPSCYQYAIYRSIKANQTKLLPEKYDDFMPYDSTPTVWWSGYFASRPSMKLIERETANLLQVARFVSLAEILRPKANDLDNLTWTEMVEQHETNCLMPLWKILGDLQHHDAVTGTEKQHVSDDYIRRVSDATELCSKFIGDFRRERLNSFFSLRNSPKFNDLANKIRSNSSRFKVTLDPVYLDDTIFCPSLNISQCDAIESQVNPERFLVSTADSTVSKLVKQEFRASRNKHFVKVPSDLETKSVLLNVYNPMARHISQHDIRLPCNGRCDLDKIKVIHLSTNEPMHLIRLPVPAGILQLPHRDALTTYEILFYANIPALGYTSFVIEDLNTDELIDEENDANDSVVKIESSIRKRKRSITLNVLDSKEIHTMKPKVTSISAVSSKSDAKVAAKGPFEYVKCKNLDENQICDLIEINLSTRQVGGVFNENGRLIRESSLSQQSAADKVIVKFDLNAGMIVGLKRVSDGSSINITQKFGFYFPANNMAQPGAYIFRPNTSEPYLFDRPAVYKMYKRKNGSFIEIHQKWADWLWQTIRVDAKKNYIEFDYVVGPIPIVPGQTGQVGREVVTRYITSMSNNGVFMTDSNDRQLLTRHRMRTNQAEELGGSFYPVMSTLMLKNTHQNLTSSSAKCAKCSTDAVAILVDRSQAGTSLNEGQMELLIHRRHTRDDNFGVGEPLNEPGEDGRGLVTRGKHRMYVKFQELQETLTGRQKLKTQLFKLPTNPRANVEFEKQFYLNKMNNSQEIARRLTPESTTTYIAHDAVYNDLNQESKKISMKPLLTFDRLRVSASEFLEIIGVDENFKVKTDLTLLNTTLPSNIHLLTLQPWSSGHNQILIRLENLDNPLTIHPYPDFESYVNLVRTYKSIGDSHQVDADDPCKDSMRAKVEVDIEYLIKSIRVVALEEYNLGANVKMDEDKRLDWTEETYSHKDCESSSKTTTVKLGPRQIRTFLAKFESL